MKTIRSRRRTLALEVTSEGALLVRAPHRLGDDEIRRFVEEKRPWIERQMARIARLRAQPAPPSFSADKERAHRECARRLFQERAEWFAKKMGLRFGKIRVSGARRRWGSCSPEGNLSFHWRLVLAPPGILDYVVVHELAHRAHMNHSPRFWAKVAEFYPEFRAARRWLKENRF